MDAKVSISKAGSISLSILELCCILGLQLPDYSRICSSDQSLDRMSVTSPGPKIFKWNVLSCMSPECTQGVGSINE